MNAQGGSRILCPATQRLGRLRIGPVLRFWRSPFPMGHYAAAGAEPELNGGNGHPFIRPVSG